MKIGGIEIGKQPFIIAEAGINHNGDLGRAVDMIIAAKMAGADCVKFQTYHTDSFCRTDDPLYPVFKRCQLPDDAWAELKSMCDFVGITFLSTPQNPEDLALLLPLGIEAIKVGSDDAANKPLLTEYASHGLPILVSLGMMSEEELLKTSMRRQQFVPLVCTSQYPCPPEEANVRRVRATREPCGFSDHTIGNTASIMAVALDACVFEKHFTLDKTMEGPDHSWACDPAELKSWVDAIREAWLMRGTGTFELSEREAEQKRKYQRRPGQQLRGTA